VSTGPNLTHRWITGLHKSGGFAGGRETGSIRADATVLNWHIEEKGPAYTWLDQGAQELLEDG